MVEEKTNILIFGRYPLEYSIYSIEFQKNEYSTNPICQGGIPGATYPPPQQPEMGPFPVGEAQNKVYF